MRNPRWTGPFTALLLSGCALAQSPAPGDPSAHHPPASSASPTPSVTADGFEQQMKSMQAMHQKMMTARTPAERAALMDEHMKLMQSGMAMMGQMRQSMGGMGMMPPGGHGAGGAPGAAPAPSGPGGSGMGQMMGMHMQMERRMALMEQMMQMMLDREAAGPRR